MPIQPTYPGVYVQEVPSGVRTIMGVSTSVAMFIGRSAKGRLNVPVLCNSFTDFVREFSNGSSLGEMPQQVKLFFDNGGSKCYAMRIADGATSSEVTLKNEGSSPVAVLKAKAKQAGIIGDLIRLNVNYNTQNPEIDFNVEVFRYEIKNGLKIVAESEKFQNVNMDTNSPRYAPVLISQKSNLVKLEALFTSPSPTNGFSLSCRPIVYDHPTALAPTPTEKSNEAISFRDSIKLLFGFTQPGKNKFKIRVDGFGPVEVDFSSIDFDALLSSSVTDIDQYVQAIEIVIQSKINDALLIAEADKTVEVHMIDGPDPKFTSGPGHIQKSKLLKICSINNGDILIYPSQDKDLSVPMMLGAAQGGLEFGAYSQCRPAANGFCFKSSDIDNIIGLGSISEVDLTTLTFSEISSPMTFESTPGANSCYTNNPIDSSSLNDNKDGVREKLKKMRDALNQYANNNPTTFFWHAELYGYRLSITTTQGGDNKQMLSFATGSEDINSCFTNNVGNYSLGLSGLGSYQESTTAGSDGNTPSIQNFEDAFDIIDKNVDIFNLLILPRDKDASSVPISNIWGKASVFCQKRRALLLMDAPEWNTVQDAKDGVINLRIGLVKDYSAIFYPKLKIFENGIEKIVGPSGAIAGVMARIDSNRGVWKAPAGTEAFLTGITGLTEMLTDAENGNLNPKAINTLRVFPNGIVNWGARTMDGDDDFQSEYKYIPVRRLALYLEESLYRGLKWVVFEPNDEPLWSQIRLNVGSFMNNLFRQGAFQGMTPKDAYFVKCDKETTTQNDINLGIVNIWVGFAPLKPAEFVILHIQQMAGQITQ
jgi:phage tail sheath protein FI